MGKMVTGLTIKDITIESGQIIKKKNGMILNRCRKSIYQTQQLFMIKMLKGLGLEGKVLTLIKGIYKKSTAKHHT